MPEICSQLCLKFTGLVKVMCSGRFVFLPAVMENVKNYELPQVTFRENLLSGWNCKTEAKTSIVIINHFVYLWIHVDLHFVVQV